jgi:hypothetical protein
VSRASTRTRTRASTRTRTRSRSRTRASCRTWWLGQHNTSYHPTSDHTTPHRNRPRLHPFSIVHLHRTAHL